VDDCDEGIDAVSVELRRRRSTRPGSAWGSQPSGARDASGSHDIQECVLVAVTNDDKPVDHAPSLALAADLALGSGDAEKAIALLDEAVRYGRDNGNQATIAAAVALGVIIMTDLGLLEVAAVLSGATSRSPMVSAWAVGAAGAGGELGVALVRSAPYRSQYEDALARLRRELSSPAFDAASAKGAAMSYDQVAVFFVSELTRVGSSIGDT
jgi:hypothetical protein